MNKLKSLNVNNESSKTLSLGKNLLQIKMKNILQGIRNKNEQNLIKKILQYQNLPKEDQSRQKLTDASEKINIEVLQEGHIIQQQEEVDPKKLHYIISGSVAEVVKDISDDSIKKSNKRKKKSCLNYEMKDLVQNKEQMGTNLRKIIDRNGYYMHSLNPGQGFGIQSISTKKNPHNKSTLIVEKDNSIFLTLTNHDCEKVLEEFLNILKAKENFLKNSIPSIEQLSQQPIFQTICESFQVQEFKKGQFLTKQNHLGEFLYLVLEGEVKISKELELDHLVHQDKQKSSVQLSLVSQNQNSKSSIFIGDEIFFKKNFELIAKDLNKFTDKKDFLTPANSLLHDQIIQKFQKKNNIKTNHTQKNYIEFEIKPKIKQENKKNSQTSKDPKDQKTHKKQEKTQEKLDKNYQNQPTILNSNRSLTKNQENYKKNEIPNEKKVQINDDNNNIKQFNINNNNNNQYNNNQYDNNNNQYNNSTNNKNNQSDQEKGKKEEDSLKKLIESALLSQNLPGGFNFKSKGQSFYDYTAQALTDVKVYFIKKYNFFEIFRRDSEFLEKMMEKLYIIFKAKTQKRQEKIDYHIKLIQKPEQINLDRKIIGFDHGKGYEVLKGMNKHSKKNIERENLLKTLQTFDYEKIQEESNKNQNKYMVGQKLQKLLDFIEYVNKNQDIFQINLNPQDIKQGQNDEISEQSDEEEDDEDEDEELEESDSDEQNEEKKKFLKKNKKKIQNKGIIKKDDVQKQIQKQLRKKNKEEQKKIQIDNEEEEDENEDEAQNNNQDPKKLQKKKIKELEKQRFNDFKSFIIKVEKEKYLNSNNNISEDNGEDNWQPPKFCRKLNLEAVSNYDQSNFKLFNDLMNDLVSKEIAINKQQNQKVVDFSNKKVKNKYEVMNILHEFLTKKSKIGSNQGIGIIDFEDQQTKKDNYYKLIQRRMIEMPVLFQWKQDKTRLQKEKQIIEKFNKREIKKNKEYLAYHQQSIGSIDYKMLLQLSEFQDSTLEFASIDSHQINQIQSQNKQQFLDQTKQLSENQNNNTLLPEQFSQQDNIQEENEKKIETKLKIANSRYDQQTTQQLSNLSQKCNSFI
ncbi:Cyclic nucleotide-binding protein [Pseudocohnilembus persalinus]|uniref:Cyclic nucleotide-binding protein n=1 Tax=Pseudocohnilembus persalinus TaxID=266149 RepID=A0A0V0R621_PSEPJ|nr:Cyclic nucleotide-binding protein [Pseudocohnilembus persalinus]|eukprot:KRX09808.1 Cyclic nucleotide-binding protein [Pseudocohnilembus persalinus]